MAGMIGREDSVQIDQLPPNNAKATYSPALGTKFIWASMLNNVFENEIGLGKA